MKTGEVNAKLEALRKKYCNPEWALMSEEEKIKDGNYAKLLYEMIATNLEFAKELKKKYTTPESIALIDDVIKNYEDMLKCFEPVCEN